MRVLVTGHDGYIGAVLLPLLRSAGHDAVGLDTLLFDNVDGVQGDPTERVVDVRDVTPSDVEGFDAVVHLAALSNDPLGDINPELTYAVNHGGTVHLARQAKEAGVSRFLFSSSCSLYGAGEPGAVLDESAPFNPVTPYGEAKLLAERDLSAMADDDFHPTYLRNATAYGASPKLRGDVVVNNLVGVALTSGEVRLQSDGMSWRPLVHVEDIAAAFLAILEAPVDAVHNEAFNVGRPGENYLVRTVAEIVGSVVPGSTVTFASGAGPDKRSYRVSFDKLPSHVPAFAPSWTVEAGARQVLEQLQAVPGLTTDGFLGPRYVRLARLLELLREGRLREDLRWRDASSSRRTSAGVA